MALIAAGVSIVARKRDAFADGHLRSEEWSLYLHRLVAGKLRQDQHVVIARARRNLESMRHAHGPAVERYASHWDALLSGPLDRLIEMMTSPAREARDLRQCTPFAGVLTARERWAAHRAFREGWSKKRAPGPA